MAPLFVLKKSNADTSIELVVTPVVSANWKGDQDKLLSDSNTDDESCQEGNVNGMLDAFNLYCQL